MRRASRAHELAVVRRGVDRSVRLGSFIVPSDPMATVAELVDHIETHHARPVGLSCGGAIVAAAAIAALLDGVDPRRRVLAARRRRHDVRVADDSTAGAPIGADDRHDPWPSIERR